jgi:hypothetical protein
LTSASFKASLYRTISDLTLSFIKIFFFTVDTVLLFILKFLPISDVHISSIIANVTCISLDCRIVKLLKRPNGANIERADLSLGDRTAAAENLGIRAAAAALRRTPIGVSLKTSNSSSV